MILIECKDCEGTGFLSVYGKERPCPHCRTNGEREPRVGEQLELDLIGESE